MSDKQEFLKELKALLKKYEVSFQAGVGSGSDTHGICGEHIELYDSKYQTVLLLDGWSLDHSDIK